MRSKKPAQGKFDRRHAIVIGGSMAGLLAACVLSDHFAQVTIIERDRLTGEAETRKGVPQGRHVHGLLARGAVIMGEYFRDLFPTLARDGAIPVGMEGIRWNQLGVWMAPVQSPVKIDVGYATRIYRCPAQLPAHWKALFILGKPPDDKRGGVILPIQGGYWMVTLQGMLRDYPPGDEAGFLAY